MSNEPRVSSPSEPADAPTAGAGPAQADGRTDARTGRNPGAGNLLRRPFVWVLVGLAAAIVAVVWIVRTDAPSPTTALQQRAEKLLQGFLAADPAALDELLDVEGRASFVLMTKESADRAFGDPGRRADLEPIQETDRVGTRTVLTVGSRQLRMEVVFTRTSASSDWELQRVPVPVVQLSTLSPTQMASVNGVEVSARGILGATFALYPGETTFASPGMQSQTSTLAPDLVPPPRDARTRPTEIRLSAKEATEAEVKALVQRRVDACQGEIGPERIDCPFSPPEPPAGSTDVRRVTFSDPRLEDKPEEGRHSGADGLTEWRGTVRATGQFKVNGAWQDFDARAPFASTFRVVHGPDGLQLADDDFSNAQFGLYGFDEAWGTAQTDRGNQR